jgi:hypothetical protein
MKSFKTRSVAVGLLAQKGYYICHSKVVKLISTNVSETSAIDIGEGETDHLCQLNKVITRFLEISFVFVQ